MSGATGLLRTCPASGPRRCGTDYRAAGFWSRSRRRRRPCRGAAASGRNCRGGCAPDRSAMPNWTRASTLAAERWPTQACAHRHRCCWWSATTWILWWPCTPRCALDAVVLLVPRSAGPAQVADILARTGAASGVAPNWAAVADVELPTRLRWIALALPRPAVAPRWHRVARPTSPLRPVHLGHHRPSPRA